MALKSSRFLRLPLISTKSRHPLSGVLQLCERSGAVWSANLLPMHQMQIRTNVDRQHKSAYLTLNACVALWNGNDSSRIILSLSLCRDVDEGNMPRFYLQAFAVGNSH